MVNFRRNIVLLLTALAFFSGGTLLFAQTLTIRTSSDSVSTSDDFTVVLDGELGNFSNYATLPDVPGLIVVSHTQSTNYNSSTKNATVHQTYVMTALTAGDYVIGPAWIQAGSRRIYSNTIHVHVYGNGNISSEGMVFLRVESDKKKVYAGEKISVAVNLYVSEDFYVSGDYPKAESYSGFWKDENLDYSYDYYDSYYDSTVYIKGKRFRRRTLLKEKLYPNAVGEILLPTYTYSCYVSRDNSDYYSYNSSQSVNLRSEPSSITVMALPDHDSLPGFAGDVGNFKMRCILTEDSTSAWDPVNFTMWITGDGNFQFMMAPDLALPSGLRAQNLLSADTSVWDGEQYVSGKMFRYSITPEQEGEFDLSGIAFSYFDAKKKEYVTLHSDSFHLEVTPGVRIDNETVNNLPDSFFEKKEKTRGYAIPLIVVAALVLPTIAFILFRRRKKRKEAEEAEAERLRLEKENEYPEYVPPPDTTREQANALLHGAGQYLHNGLVLQSVNNLYEALLIRLSGVTKMRREEISVNTLKYKLRLMKLDEELINSIMEHYEELKLKRYTLSPADGAAAHILIVRTADLIQKLG